MTDPDPSFGVYETGQYLEKNPDWHVGESPWKARQIVKMLAANDLQPRTICEIGCGAGEVLAQLQRLLSKDCVFEGFDVSPQAIALSRSRANDKLKFTLGEGLQQEFTYDLVLVLDVIEHLEDYFSFLRRLLGKGRHIMLHIPLDLSVQTILRSYGLLKRRDLYCHLHYFTKDVALRTLEELKFKIVDYEYTPRSIDMASTLPEKLLKLPRKIGFALNEDLTVRVLGGYSLMVLAK